MTEENDLEVITSLGIRLNTVFTRTSNAVEPGGFKLTGEFRVPERGEFFVCGFVEDVYPTSADYEVWVSTRLAPMLDDEYGHRRPIVERISDDNE